MRQDELLLDDILQACTAIRAYTKQGERAFVASAMAVDAVCFRIIAIGEAVGQLHELGTTLADRGAELRAKDYKRMRNELAHAYWRQYAEQIWGFAIDEVPRLERAVSAAKKKGRRGAP